MGTPPRCDYPAPPWEMQGALSLGIYRSASAGWLCLGVVRYHGAELTYDELFVGRPLRRGIHWGIWVSQIWVSTPPALWGGRDLWNLPKQLGRFSWTGDRMRLDDDEGLVAEIDFLPRRHLWPWIWLPVPFWGTLDDDHRFTIARWAGPIGRSDQNVCQWSDRFDFDVSGRPKLGFVSNRFTMTVPSASKNPGR